MSEADRFKGHTPGPWKVHPDTYNGGLERKVTGGWREPFYCQVGGGIGGVRDANARLIAAAPERERQLEALVEVLERMARFSTYADDVVTEDASWTANECIRLARAALRDVRGEG